MKKTICIYIATLTRGGAERVAVILANSFVRAGYRVLLITLEPDEGLYSIDEGVEHLVVNEKGGNRLHSALKRITDLRRIFKENKACAVISFIGKTNIRAILACLFIPTKSIVSVRTAPAREYPGRLGAMLARLCFGLADGAVFQTRAAADFFGKKVSERSAVLFNPLDEHYVTDRVAEERSSTIITVGRMDRVKNHALLVEAFALVHSRHPEAELVIYGDGECMDDIKTRVKRLGLEAAVRLPGDVIRVWEHTKNAGVFVLSSDFEGMPNAVAEAMAFGTPVVCTDCPSGGARALVGSRERGLLVPVGSPEAMAEAICRLLEDAGLWKQLSAAGYAFSKRLHPGMICGQWRAYVEEVVNGR